MINRQGDPRTQAIPDETRAGLKDPRVQPGREEFGWHKVSQARYDPAAQAG
jgi:hypothetical protein